MAQGLLKLSTHTSSINIVKYHKLLGPFEFSRTSRNTSLYFIRTSVKCFIYRVSWRWFDKYNKCDGKKNPSRINAVDN